MTESDRDRPASLRPWTLLAGLVAVGLLAACGAGETPVDEPPARTARAQRAPEPAPGAERDAPRIASVRLAPDLPVAGGDITAEVELAGDVRDSAALHYEWRLGGETVDGRGRTLRLPDDSKGSAVEVFVSIGDDAASDSVGRATARVANRRPTIRSVALEPQGGPASDDDVTAIPAADDPDGDSLDFRFEWHVNDRIAASGPANTLPRDQTRRGDRVFVVATASDGESRSVPFESEAVTVTNAAPRIVSKPGQIGVDGVFRYEVRAEDPDGDRAMRYRLTRSPDGMSIDPYSGAVEWAPGEKQMGTHRVSIAVDDSHGGTASQEIEVRVALEGPEAPAAPAPR